MVIKIDLRELNKKKQTVTETNTFDIDFSLSASSEEEFSHEKGALILRESNFIKNDFLSRQ